ncbi:hypothetical protein ACFX16_043882 [Malus domestica]
MRNLLCGNYGQLCQKARNLYSSPIHRLPTLSERTVPVVKASPISFYLRLPQQKHTHSAHPLNTSSSPKMHSQRTLSSHSVFLIPWDTPANNPFKAKVFHIMKVESKSISYHAFSLSFLQPAPALEYSSSCAFALSLTYKGSEDDTSKHVETTC